MGFFKRVKSDRYLKAFVRECKEGFGKNLVAVVVFGSYSLGYFDKKKSDYDVFVILKERVDNSVELKKVFMRRFPKISLQYLLGVDELVERAHFGHWTSYITLLTSGRVVYERKGKYRKVLKRLKKINLLEKLIDVAIIEAKTKYELGVLEKNRGFKAVKWAVPVIRKRLQLLSYVRSGRLVWDLGKNLKRNRDVLSLEEIFFIKKLNKRLFKRSNNFSAEDKAMTKKITKKINREITGNLRGLWR